MDVRTRISRNLSLILLFLYLALFPLGQLLRFSIDFLGKSIPIHTADLIVGITIFPLLLGKFKKPKVYGYLLAFILVAFFSLILSIFNFPLSEVFLGLLYLVRFFAYSALFVMTWNLIGQKKIKKETVFNSLILVTVIVGFFGWVQYILYPDLRDLKYIGWDDHLYRLVGAFLDPTFTGLILVLGFLLSLVKFFSSNDKRFILIILFLLLSVAFTYSRASYLALLGGLLLTLIILKRKIAIAGLFFLFLILLPFLPRPSSEGVKLERMHSIWAKVGNYAETVEIFKRYPVFGVGFNNLCSARVRLFGDSYLSHSCFGSDSSLLFILATTGILGFLVFLNMGYQMLKSVGKDVYGVSFTVTSFALFLHGFFANSFFYPWIMGFMGILLALSVKESRRR